MADSYSLALIVPMDQLLHLALTTLVFSLIGILLFCSGVSDHCESRAVLDRKEIEEDQKHGVGHPDWVGDHWHRVDCGSGGHG